MVKRWENIERADFLGVGEYDIPTIEPVEFSGNTKFIPFNYAASCKKREDKSIIEKEVPQLVRVPTKVSDLNKAAELLGKRYALFTDKVETDVDMDLNITIDYGDNDNEES